MIMDYLIIVAAVLISLAIGVTIGTILRKKIAESKIEGAEKEAKRLVDLAKIEAENMKKEEIIEYALSLPNTYEDYPFPEDNFSVTMKHKNTNKWFALIMKVQGKLYVNVKTNPDYSDMLRSAYDYIIPAYHMNKEHWNTIIIEENTDENIVKELIEQSYELTKNKR